MKLLTAIIEFADNNLSAYIKGVDGVIGIGDSIDDVKKSLIDSIKLHKELCVEDGFEIEPELQGDYELVYKYDMASFLNVYGHILSKSGLEALTGINQKQLWHYANGKSKPRQNTIDKVQTAIHQFANELLQVEFA